MMRNPHEINFSVRCRYHSTKARCWMVATISSCSQKLFSRYGDRRNHQIHHNHQ